MLTAQEHQDMSNAQYIFVANRSDFTTDSEPPEDGNSIDVVLPVGVHPQGIFVFADRYDYQKKTRKTAVHEIAHSLQIGEANDDCNRGSLGGEIYSGDKGIKIPNDRTPELYNGTQRWSIMSSG